MPSLKLLVPPVTADMIAAGAITTEKLADGAVVPAKVGAGVMSSKISFDHTKTTYILNAGAETTIYSFSGNGAVVVLFQGDGDGTFKIRIYVDGTQEDEFSTNEPRVATYSFGSSIAIRLYNPTTSGQEKSSVSFGLRGVAR